MAILIKILLNETGGALITNGIPPVVRFWTYLIFDTCSILCSFFIVYYFLSLRVLRRALHNHIIIVLLCTGLLKELISIPWTLYRLQFGSPLGRTHAFYLCSFFFDYGLFTTQVMLVAWTAFERHISIFYEKYVMPKRNRYLIHYLPPTILLIYCFIYYSVIAFAPFCENSFTAYLAGGHMIPCAYKQIGLVIWELVIHQLIPTLMIVIFNIAVLVRVIKQKRKVHLPIVWRRHRRMIIQILMISALYLIFNSPWTVTLFAVFFGLSKESKEIYTVHGLFLRNFIIFLYPFLCIGTTKILRKKFKQKLRSCRSYRPS